MSRDPYLRSKARVALRSVMLRVMVKVRYVRSLAVAPDARRGAEGSGRSRRGWTGFRVRVSLTTMNKRHCAGALWNPINLA